MSGFHYLVDFWNIENPDLWCNADYLEIVLKGAADAANAKILHTYFHHFGQEEHGVTGIVAVAESHLTIHTWPENNYAAIDIFLCGECYPQVALDYLIKEFRPNKYQCKIEKRG